MKTPAKTKAESRTRSRLGSAAGLTFGVSESSAEHSSPVRGSRWGTPKGGLVPSRTRAYCEGGRALRPCRPSCPAKRLGTRGLDRIVGVPQLLLGAPAQPPMTSQVTKTAAPQSQTASVPMVATRVGLVSFCDTRADDTARVARRAGRRRAPSLRPSRASRPLRWRPSARVSLRPPRRGRAPGPQPSSDPRTQSIRPCPDCPARSSRKAAQTRRISRTPSGLGVCPWERGLVRTRPPCGPDLPIPHS